MKGIKNENDGKKSLHGILRNGTRRNGKTLQKAWPQVDIDILQVVVRMNSDY